MTQSYEIRVKGHLDLSWSDWFGGLAIAHETNGETRLTGTLAYQAALHGLLGRVRDLGLQLISVNMLEKPHLTFRQSVAALSRRTWSYAQSERHLLLHCEWFRLSYHLVRAHESLALQVPGLQRRFRSRSPAMALGLTAHLWNVSDLLHHPVPQAA